MNKTFYLYMSVQGMGRNVLVCLITILLFVSCQSYKKVPYLQDAEFVQQTVQHENLYDAKIMPAYYCGVMYQSRIGCSIQFDCSESWQCGYWKYTVDNSACPTALFGG